MTTPTPAPAGLDELDALLTAATPGPWQYDAETPGEVWDGDERYPHVLGGCEESADAALIVALRNRAPAMLAAIRATYALAEELERDAAMLEPDHGYRYTDSASRLRTTLDEALGVEK